MSYTDDVLVTLDTAGDPDRNLMLCVAGLVGETGEVVDLMKKVVFHRKPLDQQALKLELGDVRWYIEAALYLANHRGGEGPFTILDISDVWPIQHADLHWRLMGGAMMLSMMASNFLDDAIDFQNEHLPKSSREFPMLRSSVYGKRTLGTMLHVISGMAMELGSSLEEIERLNISKLQKRYSMKWIRHTLDSYQPTIANHT